MRLTQTHQVSGTFLLLKILITVPVRWRVYGWIADVIINDFYWEIRSVDVTWRLWLAFSAFKLLSFLMRLIFYFLTSESYLSMNKEYIYCMEKHWGDDFRKCVQWSLWLLRILCSNVVAMHLLLKICIWI